MRGARSRPSRRVSYYAIGGSVSNIKATSAVYVGMNFRSNCGLSGIISSYGSIESLSLSLSLSLLMIVDVQLSAERNDVT